MRRWNSLLLAILLIHFALSQTPYDGPEMICNSTAGSNILSGWCSKTNPYSTRPKFLTDFSLDDRIYPFKPVCEGRGEAYDKCEIVTSIKTTVSQDMPVAIAGLKTGEIVGLRLNDFFLFPVEYTKNDQSLLFMDLVDKYLVVVKQNTAAPYTDYSIICYDVSIRYKRWTRSLSYEWDGEIKKMKLFKTELGHYVAVFLTKNRVSYESKLIFHAFRNVVTEMEIYKTTWTLTHGDFNFDVFEQKWDLPTNSGSLKIKPDAKFRTLVVIHNDFIIKIVGYTFDPSKPAQSKPLVLNFDEKEKDSHSETTTFYRSELQISACILFGEVIRRPNPSSNSTLFHPSQNLHLAVVHSHQYATQSLVIKSIPEFRSISSYVTVEDYDINVINAIPDLSSSNIQFSQMLPFRQSPISLLQSRFIDVPEEVSGEPSYDQLTGSLRPDVLCATFKISPLWSSQHNDSSLLECYQQLGSVQDEIQLLTASNNLNQIKTYLDAFFNSYWNIQLYMASKTHVEFFTLTQSFNHSDRFSFVGLVNTIDSLSGKVKDMHVTANGQYVFLSISRLRYELDSTKRSYEICDELKRDPDNKFLKAYQPACKASPPPHNADINQFSLVVSSCTDNVNCPSVHRTIINSEGFPPGKFLLRSNALVDCPIGSYCQGGMRFDCPPGFFCNKQRLVAPIPCSHSANTTCYNVGLTAPEPCPDGAICTTAYSTPVYSPPGYYLESTTHRLHECRLGDYCALGRESTGGNLTNLLCPAKTVCHNSSVLEPVICDANKTIDFCPEGTHERSLCPAGYYCTNLDVRVACRKSQYCPPGSFASQVCPAGFYCPDPSKKIACPQGYYCTQGSTEPRRCNFFFSKCTSESTNDQLTYVGIALLFVLFLSVTLLWLLYLVAYRIYRHQSKMRRKGIESTSFYDSMYGIEPAELARIASPPSILGDNGYGTLIDQDENNFRQDQFTVDLRFEELGLELRTDGTRVLKGVTGEIKHGQLTAVMGMSGAGKSTFVTTLAGRAYYGQSSG
ncbi:hypothetical protein AKO1_009805 [Acrasis kona]|uniref:ABC transporter domain-containing protein n=1 Tax=Acrasis kona TaxID=1008807 RepID=A0AAW2ZQC2_9EUKA